jgi:methionyl-tRNA formyltransferase
LIPVLSATPAGIIIACDTGSIILHELQVEGRKRMNAAAFLAGRQLPAGTQMQ